MKIAILGAGYVGLNTAAAFAWLGHDVRIIDKDRDRIAILEQGRSPIHEPGLAALLDQCRPRLGFSTDTAPVADADRVFIAVGTPAGQHGEAHIGFVEDAAREVAAALSPDGMPTLVVKSTVPIGTGRSLRALPRSTLAQDGACLRPGGSGSGACACAVV